MSPAEILRPLTGSRASSASSSILLVAVAVLVAMGVFHLTLAGSIALYFVVWWTVLFAVLPIGRGAHDGAAPVPGADSGAPSSPMMLEKVVWTTIAADVVFVALVSLLPLAGL